jgi:hypothetical protein
MAAQSFNCPSLLAKKYNCLDFFEQHIHLPRAADHLNSEDSAKFTDQLIVPLLQMLAGISVDCKNAVRKRGVVECSYVYLQEVFV